MTADEQTYKHDEGKPKCGHLLEVPNALRAMANVAEHGASKYGARTWPKVSAERHLNAMMRHTLQLGPDGRGVDIESLQAHLAHIMWDAAMAYELLFGKPMQANIEKQWER